MWGGGSLRAFVWGRTLTRWGWGGWSGRWRRGGGEGRGKGVGWVEGVVVVGGGARMAMARGVGVGIGRDGELALSGRWRILRIRLDGGEERMDTALERRG